MTWEMGSCFLKSRVTEAESLARGLVGTLGWVTLCDLNSFHSQEPSSCLGGPKPLEPRPCLAVWKQKWEVGKSGEGPCQLPHVLMALGGCPTRKVQRVLQAEMWLLRALSCSAALCQAARLRGWHQPLGAHPPPQLPARATLSWALCLLSSRPPLGPNSLG